MWWVRFSLARSSAQMSRERRRLTNPALPNESAKKLTRPTFAWGKFGSLRTLRIKETKDLNSQRSCVSSFVRRTPKFNTKLYVRIWKIGDKYALCKFLNVSQLFAYKSFIEICHGIMWLGNYAIQKPHAAQSTRCRNPPAGLGCLGPDAARKAIGFSLARQKANLHPLPSTQSNLRHPLVR